MRRVMISLVVAAATLASAGVVCAQRNDAITEQKKPREQTIGGRIALK